MNIARFAAIVLIAAALGGCALLAGGEDEDSADPLAAAARQSPKYQAYAAQAERFRQRLAKQPKDLEALLGLARNLRYMGLAGQAGRVLEENLEAFAANPRLLAELGRAELAAGQAGPAIDRLQASIGGDPAEWRTYSALGIAYDYEKSRQLAAAAYRTALELCIDNPTVLNNMAVSAVLAGDVDGGIAILKRIPPFARQSAPVQNNLALFNEIRGLCAKCREMRIGEIGAAILYSALLAADAERVCVKQAKPAPPPQPMVAQLKPQAAAEPPSIDLKVTFEFASAVLTEEAMELLAPLGRALVSAELAGYRFALAGHTDAVGSEAYNQDLSERRAKAVLDYLVENFAIDPARLQSVGYGESRLLDAANPLSGVNRRVRITNMGKAGGS